MEAALAFKKRRAVEMHRSEMTDPSATTERPPHAPPLKRSKGDKSERRAEKDRRKAERRARRREKRSVAIDVESDVKTEPRSSPSDQLWAEASQRTMRVMDTVPEQDDDSSIEQEPRASVTVGMVDNKRGYGGRAPPSGRVEILETEQQNNARQETTKTTFEEAASHAVAVSGRNGLKRSRKLSAPLAQMTPVEAGCQTIKKADKVRANGPAHTIDCGRGSEPLERKEIVVQGDGDDTSPPRPKSHRKKHADVEPSSGTTGTVSANTKTHRKKRTVPDQTDPAVPSVPTSHRTKADMHDIEATSSTPRSHNKRPRDKEDEASLCQPKPHKKRHIETRLTGEDVETGLSATKSHKKKSTPRAEMDTITPYLEPRTREQNARPSPGGHFSGTKPSKASSLKKKAVSSRGDATQAPQRTPRSHKKKTPTETNATLANNQAPAEADGDPANLPTSGAFVPLENAIISSFVNEFRHEHALTQSEFNRIVQSRDKSDPMAKQIWNGLVAVLPRRTRKAVQRGLRTRYHNNGERGPWNADEDARLREAYAARPQKWTYIGGLVGRLPEDCKDRWRNLLVYGEKRGVGTWTEDEVTRLRQAVAECVDLLCEAKAQESVEGTRPTAEEVGWSDVSWAAVSERLGGSRSRLQCYSKWKSLVTLVA